MRPPARRSIRPRSRPGAAARASRLHYSSPAQPGKPPAWRRPAGRQGLGVRRGGASIKCVARAGRGRGGAGACRGGREGGLRAGRRGGGGAAGLAGAGAGRADSSRAGQDRGRGARSISAPGGGAWLPPAGFPFLPPPAPPSTSPCPLLLTCLAFSLSFHTTPPASASTSRLASPAPHL